MDVWGLITKLIEEATGMTGNEVIDKIHIERGAGYVEAFKREHPALATLITMMLNGSPQDALNSLSIYNPQAAKIPLAKEFLTELQKRLKQKIK